MNKETNKTLIKSGILLLNDYASSVDFITEGSENVLPFKRKSMIESSTLLSSLSDGSLGFNCPDVLPKNCRYFSFAPWDDTICLVVEQSPTTRSVKIDMDLSFPLEELKKLGKAEAYGYKGYKPGTRFNTLRLAFPYVIFIINLSNDIQYRGLRVFYRTAPLTSVHDFLLKSNMMNVGVDGGMCISGEESSVATAALGNLQKKVTIQERINQVLNRVWLSTFNRDLNGAHEKYKDVPQVGNLLEWQYFSKVDPMFVFNVSWFQHERNLLTEVKPTVLRTQEESIVQRMGKIISGKAEGKFFLERAMSECLYIEDGDFKLDSGDDEDDEEQVINEDHSTDYKQSFTISVGDQLVIDKKPYFITALKALSNSSYIDVIELEDEEGKTEDHKFDLRLKKKIIRFLKKKPENSVVTKNGKTIKRGDMIALKIPGYEKIISADEVRTSRDGLTEVKCGKDVYLLDFVNFDIIDQDKLELEGIKFQKGEKYLIKDTDHIQYKVLFGTVCTFDYFKNGRLCFTKFDSTMKVPTRGDIKIDILHGVSTYVKKIEKDLVPIPAVRLGNRIFVSEDKQEIFISKDRDVIIPGEATYYCSQIPRYTSYIPTMLLEDGKRFFLPAHDIDIDLRVGDNVIVTSWETPSDLLKIRKITDFKFDSKKQQIEVGTIIGDDKNTQRSFLLVDFHRGSITSGCIRKASYSVDGLTVGMEVSPLNRVPGFLKSKSCRISAFIVDSEVPLVLCSNFHTFWLTENNRKLFRFNESPSPGFEFPVKFTPQYGDILGRPSYEECHPLYFTSSNGRNSWRQLPDTTSTIWVDFRGHGFPKYQDLLFYGLISQRSKKIPGSAVPDMFNWYYSVPEISRDIM